MDPQSDDDRAYWHDFLYEKVVTEQSFRAAVIIAGAILEEALEGLLRSRLVPLATQQDPFFDGPYAPLATFSAKIDLAYRLGLLGARMTRDLHLVRKIRNDCAHSAGGPHWEDPTVRNRVNQLTRSQNVAASAPERRKQYPEGPSGDFMITVAWILWWITAVSANLKSLEPATDWTPGGSAPPNPK